MSPADLAVVGSEPDLLQRVTAIVRAAATSPVSTRAEAITEAAHGITDIIRDQSTPPALPAAPVHADPEEVDTLRRLAAYLAGLEQTLRPICRHTLTAPLRGWQRTVHQLADQLGGER